MIKFHFLIFILILVNYSLPQNTLRYGNLVHFLAKDDVIDHKNTTGNWSYDENDSRIICSYYFTEVKTDTSQYVLRLEKCTNQPEHYVPEYTRYEIENIKTGERKEYLYIYRIDYLPIYDLASTIYEIENGTWIFNDIDGGVFLSNNDSLSLYCECLGECNGLYHISGQVDHRYFILCNNADWENLFWLADLSDSPVITSPVSLNNQFLYQDRPVAIQKYTDSLFFIKVQDIMKLYHFQGDSFSALKTVLEAADFDHFRYRNNNLYYKNENGLYKYIYDSEGSLFINDTLLLDKPDFVDNDYKYALKLDESTLQLYNIDEEQIQKSWILDSLFQPFQPFLNYPDIYVHNQAHPDPVYIIHSSDPVISGFKLDAYPNPFNPITNIEFRISNHEFVTLKIFDILGREVITLVNEHKPAGTYTIQWNGRNTQGQPVDSGIYFYRLKSNNLVASKKCILLK
ncbi:MAG: T9SS type A sorting domain-containing protein [Calditrichaceae bacterium]|nr:T9SS type A sorting domain-containing protein [Calditrichaceae bacterium]MBN2708021.1 T9SS type A sorting domain-containing protein [Calditrichaceae bacterium]